MNRQETIEQLAVLGISYSCEDEYINVFYNHVEISFRECAYCENMVSWGGLNDNQLKEMKLPPLAEICIECGLPCCQDCTNLDHPTEYYEYYCKVCFKMGVI